MADAGQYSKCKPLILATKYSYIGLMTDRLNKENLGFNRAGYLNQGILNIIF